MPRKFIDWPIRTPMFRRLTGGQTHGGRGSQFGKGEFGGPGGAMPPEFIMEQAWQEGFSANGQLLKELINEVDALKGIEGLPFSGILGDGRDGRLQISSNTTATRTPPIYQQSRFTVDSGVTWTAEASNPGGFFMACQGRVTIDGTITLNSRGALGGDGVANLHGKTGGHGVGFAGAGAAGGGAIASREGGDGGPILYSRPVLGTDDQYGGTTNWFTTATAARVHPIIIASALGAAGATGNAGGSLSANDTRFFDQLFSFYRSLTWGWGSGGGAGGADVGDGTGGRGGYGGGTFVLLCNELDFPAGGTVNANGEAGQIGTGSDPAGGGGGGGGCVIVGARTIISQAGTINVNGGAAGALTGSAFAGGAGSAGYSKVFLIRI